MRLILLVSLILFPVTSAASAQAVDVRVRRAKGGLDSAEAKPVRFNPKHADSYYKRGLARQTRGEFDRALDDFNQALRFDPNHAKTYFARGVLWQNKGKFEKAIADYDETLRIDPQQAGAYANRGIAWHQLRRFEKAVADWKQTIRLDAKHVPAHCYLAWLLATCPDPRYRDGKRAVELATAACEMSDWKYPHGLIALAAAFAETGDFDNAVKWQTEFLRLCPEDDRKKWEFLLDLYKSQKPFRGGRQESRPETGFG